MTPPSAENPSAKSYHIKLELLPHCAENASVPFSGGPLLLGLIFHEQLRKLLFQRFDFRTIANLNIGVVGIVVSVVLMIVLGAIESFERRHLGHNRLWKDLLPIELRNIRFRETHLLLIGIEDCRPVGCAHVRSLPV